MFITSIDQEKIREFGKWRIEEFKRFPAKFTIQTHNAALQMTFKEAIVRKWMFPMQVPILNSEDLTWGDIHMETETKGKTTKHTGTRKIVYRDEIFSCIEELRERFSYRKPSNKLFRLADGSKTKELGKALVDIGLKQSAHGVRTLYSLRHTYITWQLMSGEVSMEVLAK